jgi:hypothetical protein
MTNSLLRQARGCQRASRFGKCADEWRRRDEIFTRSPVNQFIINGLEPVLTEIIPAS